ncbi:MAG: PRC-barrel domain-containing protein [Candidatus Bathyarchaeota archaeon]|nr:PRC-barrel domain-containing protein [Candidatus Bathyarchaeota archaeon]
MEKSDKPLTRDALLSMQVIDAQGHLLGTIQDVIFKIGSMGVSLKVVKATGETLIIDWEDVQGAADFVVVKPQAVKQQFVQPQATAQPAQPAQSASAQACPTCGKPLTWIAQYNRWYCYNEQKYV